MPTYLQSHHRKNFTFKWTAACLAMYHSEDKEYAPAIKDTPLDSSHPPDSNDTLADPIRLMALELRLLLVSSPGGVATEFSLVTAIGVPPPRALYHSIRLIRQILMGPLRTLVDAWLVRYPSFSSTESYSHAPATSHLPFDSSGPPDSNETLADLIRPLAVELPLLLVSFISKSSHFPPIPHEACEGWGAKI